ncbi:gustatory receptor for sugar taste 43a-like [Hylaeus anthracinus]|uniref:gustatory receptor for sugar taste 43a-like n=1 Tax=Hylaeus anthracinus TaxID=313031 RepID=UPI0023B8DD5A|nr:gustatory receptor for sugar taste 43a-like [Hylaeus anthracinus]
MLPENRSKTSQNIVMKLEGKKDKRTAQSLYWASFPIHYLGKLWGLIPVRFVTNAAPGRCQARLSTIDLIYSLCVLLLLLGLQICGLWRDLKNGWQHSTRLRSRQTVIATCSDVLGVMSLTVVCIVGSPFRWRYLQAVINKLIEVDEKVDESSTKKSRRFTIYLTVCSLTYLWFNSILDFYSWHRKTKGMTDLKTIPDKGPINYMPLYLMYTVIILTEIQYTVSTYNVELRFISLNNSIKKLFEGGSAADYLKKCVLETTGQTHLFGQSYAGYATVAIVGDTRKQSSSTVSRRQFELASYRNFRNLNENETYVNSISELITVHSSLCDAVSLINSAYGVVILAVTVTCLLHLVITPYFLILQVDENHEWIYLLVQCMWCIFHVTRMLIIVQPSYSTVAEGKKTAVLVSRLLSSSFEVDSRQQLEIFSLQLLHRPLEFSACGLFSLDRTLITSIAGVVTTYLVILIQFKNADDTMGEVDRIRNATQILKSASSLQNLTGFKSII